MKMRVWAAALFGLLVNTPIGAYEFSTGKVFVRGVIGPVINVVHSDETPLGGFISGVEGEWVVARPWALIVGYRPTFSLGSIDMGFGLGIKYRWDDLGVPFIINAAFQLTPSVFLPFGGKATHFNIGLRPSIGLDYFLMRDLVIGGEFGVDPSWLVTERIGGFEASVEILASLMYRL